uniref:Uncharacterized protein n=1 Tax=Megaselia scalaris TaxID=36166 RepID=T1GW40_MEGSC
MKSTSPLHPVNICSSSHNEHISICRGDSGGPFVKEFPNGSPVQGARESKTLRLYYVEKSMGCNAIG